MSYTAGTNVGVTWGSGITSATHSNAAWGVVSTGESFTEEATSTEIKDRNGNVFGIVYSDYKEKLSLTIYPSDTAAILPTIGETMTVTATDTQLAGKWVVLASSMANKSEGIAEWSVELSRSATMRDDSLINNEA